MPVVAVLAVNRRCNSRCTYCGVWADEQPDPPLSDVLAAVDQFAAIGVALVGLTGGEPLLRSDLEAIVSHAKGVGLRVTVTTNGILATEERIRSLADAGLDALSFSLDTLDPEAYHSLRGIPIDGVLAGIESARGAESGMVIGVTAVVSDSGAEHMVSLGEYCLERNLLLGLTPLHTDHGVGAVSGSSAERGRGLPVSFSRVRELIERGLRFPNSARYLDGLEDLLLSRGRPAILGCRGAERTLSVGADGAIHVCPYMPSVGSADEGGIAAFWGSDEHRQMHARMMSGACAGCWHSYRADDYGPEWVESWFAGT